MNNINLADFFQRKKEQENALTKELIEKAKTLREAISHPLKIVFNAKWLLDLYTATLAGEYLSYRLGEEIKDIELWQSAWKDEIEVKYVKKNNVISIHFRLIGIVKKGKAKKTIYQALLFGAFFCILLAKAHSFHNTE